MLGFAEHVKVHSNKPPFAADTLLPCILQYETDIPTKENPDSRQDKTRQEQNDPPVANIPGLDTVQMTMSGMNDNNNNNNNNIVLFHYRASPYGRAYLVIPYPTLPYPTLSVSVSSEILGT